MDNNHRYVRYILKRIITIICNECNKAIIVIATNNIRARGNF